MAVRAEQVVVILLAAGRASRFGSDKLAHPFRGEPLAAHAAATLITLPFMRHFAVVGATRLDFAALAFEVVHAPEGAPMSVSLQCGAAAAEATGCDACLIALGDMPFVPVRHLCALLAAHQGGVTATLLGVRRMVPAIIDRSEFARVAALQGDEGARSLLHNAPSVPAPERWLRDIDTLSDLARYERDA